jgi:tetratricopeptide (TPR) repeat protein
MAHTAGTWIEGQLGLPAVALAVLLACLAGPGLDSPAGAAEAPPQRDVPAPRTAADWALKGWDLVRAADYRGAADAFTAASRLDGREPSYLVGLGLSRHRLSQDEAAAVVLTRALELDPNVGQAHALLGDIHERRGELPSARRHYETALRQDPNDVLLQERLAEVTREAGVTSRMDRLFSAHFIVRYRGRENRALAHQVADRLEQAFQRIGRLLSYAPAEPFTVLLYPDGQFQAATRIPAWSHGFFDGRIHLPREAVTQSSRNAGRLLDHEYAHAVVHRLSGGHAPTWLDEGLARYCEGTAKSSRPALEDRDTLYSLHGDFMGLTHRPAAAAYEQSLAAVTALIERHGLAKVRQLLETLLATPDFARAFQEVFEEPYSDFNRAWILSEDARRKG